MMYIYKEASLCALDNHFLHVNAYITCFLLWQTGVEINPGIYPIVPSLLSSMITNSTSVTERLVYQLQPPFNVIVRFFWKVWKSYECVHLLQQLLSLVPNNIFPHLNWYFEVSISSMRVNQIEFVCRDCPGAFKLHCFQFCFVLDSKCHAKLWGKKRDTLELY